MPSGRCCQMCTNTEMKTARLSAAVWIVANDAEAEGEKKMKVTKEEAENSDEAFICLLEIKKLPSHFTL